MEFLMMDWLGTPVWFWLAFIGIVITLTAFDLGILHKEDKEMGIAESLKLSAFYISIAMLFGLWVWFQKGADMGMKYYTGFFIEKALSIDNVFVISLIFTFFAIPRKYQYRALLWGIIAVIVLRGLMIAAGAAIVQEYYWTLYIFAAFLIGTGIKMLFSGDEEMDVAKNPVVKFISRHMRVTKLHDEVLVKVQDDNRQDMRCDAIVPRACRHQPADLVFAVDWYRQSLPSPPTRYLCRHRDFGVLYFALAAMVHRFHYLKYALALVLVFIGSKISFQTS
jgi:tellurite resistance protein TerC